MPREFAIVPPDLRLAMLIAGLIVAVNIAVVALFAREEPLVLCVLPILAISIGASAWWALRRRISLDDGRLRVVSGLLRITVPATALDLDTARVVNLANEAPLRPWLKTFGMAMPGYRAGYFRLRNRSRAFVMLTDTARVLALSERGGRTLLLSVEKPQALLDALRDVARKAGRR